MSILADSPVVLPCRACSESPIALVAGASSIPTRYLKVRDEASDNREAFVRSVFSDLTCLPFFDEGTFALSRADTDYDILILDSSDPVRTARYLRINRALLRNVAKFAIMQESSPSRRARMLMAGCDDVFDCARTSPEEAALRVNAVMRRYNAREAIRQEGQRSAADMAHFAAPHTLTPRECTLLKALAGQPGKAMSASQLCRFVAPQDLAQFKRSLNFAISRLRGKLYPHWRIRTAADTGYTLVRLDAGIPEVAVTGEIGRRRQPRKRLPQQELPASAFDQTRSAA